MTLSVERSRVEYSEQWREWIEKVPYLKFPESWEVQVTPPFCGALVRFQVRKGKAKVSVYLDVDNSLGCYWDDDGKPKPYWEIYPYQGDTYRCDMDQTYSLIHAIAESLLEQDANERLPTGNS